jgi:hypothetical protein
MGLRQFAIAKAVGIGGYDLIVRKRLTRQRGLDFVTGLSRISKGQGKRTNMEHVPLNKGAFKGFY